MFLAAPTADDVIRCSQIGGFFFVAIPVDGDIRQAEIRDASSDEHWIAFSVHEFRLNSIRV